MENSKKFSPPPHETETYKKIMKLNEMGKTISKPRKGETKKEYRDRLLKGTSKFNQKTDSIKKRDTSNDDDVFDGKEFKKQEPKEQTTAGSSGSFEAPVGGSVIKRKITTINNSKPQQDIDEITDASSSGAFDVPAFGKTTKGGRKDPLAIGGPKTIAQSRAVKDKNFPKFGGPGGVFVKVKEKCKKFPYCNQGDINAIEPLKEAIQDTAKTLGIPSSEVEKLVLKEIKRIFI